MKSNLTKTEFKQRLAELTSKEKIFYFITPFRFSGKPFCGTFGDSSFDLTRNSFWPHVKAIGIKGEYVRLDHKATEVFYEIGISKPSRFLARLFFAGSFVGINVVLISTGANVSVIFTFIGFWIFGGLWSIALHWVSTKIVNQRFQAEFEIEKSGLP